MNVAITLFTLFLLATALPASAQDMAYRWVDEDGVTHFSDQPPPGEGEVVAVPIPDYEPPSGPTFSYVAMLERLRALEWQVEETRRAADARPTPAPIVIQQPPYPEVRYVNPYFFPHRPGLRPHPGRPDTPARQTSADRFDRLVEGTRDRYRPPGN